MENINYTEEKPIAKGELVLRYKLDWSKLKKLLENHICDKLKHRVQIHLTHYRSANNGHEPESRFWITIDKREVFSASKLKWLREWYELTLECNFSYDESEKMLKERGDFPIDEFPEAIKEYLSLPFSEALTSNNFIIKAFSMLDKRLGKKRLANILLTENEHPLVREFYELRCDAEDIKL